MVLKINSISPYLQNFKKIHQRKYEKLAFLFFRASCDVIKLWKITRAYVRVLRSYAVFLFIQIRSYKRSLLLLNYRDLSKTRVAKSASHLLPSVSREMFKYRDYNMNSAKDTRSLARRKFVYSVVVNGGHPFVKSFNQKAASYHHNRNHFRQFFVHFP